MRTRVAVLGGGLLGACTALELARSGVHVDLYERLDRCLTHTSVRNEGKLHLGYVYANDPTLDTARTMIGGAVAFAPLLRRWLGSRVDSIPVAPPFFYAVHAGSMLSTEQVEDHLGRCHAILAEEGGPGGPDYFGSDYRAAPERIPEAELGSLFDARSVTAAFRTPEIAIDTSVLAALVRERLAAEERIDCHVGAHVHGVRPDGDAVEVEFERAGRAERAAYDHVVNALWDGRLALDASAGLEPWRPWLFRLKYFLRMRAPSVAAAIPSTTVVLGPFGDVLGYGNGEVYLSWYPAGMRDTASTLSPPPEWTLDLSGAEAERMRQDTVASLERIVPAVAALRDGAVEAYAAGGGVIFAWGATDIDDSGSELHERHAIGPRSYGRYHSVDTGKLTMAPLYAKAVADRIIAAG